MYLQIEERLAECSARSDYDTVKIIREKDRHKFSEDLDDRIIICTSLLARNKIETFLDWTWDEKWITYKTILMAYCEPEKSSTSKPKLSLYKR